MRNEKGGAYIFILAVMLSLFLLLAAVLGVTASGRKISGYYMRYAGLYDLAVAGNEKALFLLRGETERGRAAADSYIRSQLASDGIENHLIYRDRKFHLAFPEGGYYAQQYRRYMDDAFKQFCEDKLHKIQGKYLYSYRLALGNGEAYEVKTTLAKTGGGYAVSTTAYKEIDGKAGYPAVVEAEIEWRNKPHTEICVPEYGWRDSAPDKFATGLYASGEITSDDALPVAAWAGALPLSSFLEPGTGGILIESGHAWRFDNAVSVVDAPDTEPESDVDVQSFYANGSPVPTLLIYTGAEPLRLHADSAENEFNGIIVSRSGISVENVTVTGQIFSDGDIILTSGSQAEADAEMLFKIPLAEETRQMMLDWLGLTRFADADMAGGTDIASLLGSVCITGFDIQINNFDVVEPVMIKSKKVDG